MGEDLSRIVIGLCGLLAMTSSMRKRELDEEFLTAKYPKCWILPIKAKIFQGNVMSSCSSGYSSL